MSGESTDIVKADPRAALSGIEIRTVDDYQRFAKIAVASGLLNTRQSGPGAIAEAVIKMARGAELGIGATASLTDIHVVEGKPCLSSNLMAALVDRSPRHCFAVTTHSDVVCAIAWSVDGKDCGQTKFSWDDAVRAGLAGKQNWRKYPRDMLFARAFASGARKFCGALFVGCAYLPEEMERGDRQAVSDVAPDARPGAMSSTAGPEILDDHGIGDAADLAKEVASKTRVPDGPRPIADDDIVFSLRKVVQEAKSFEHAQTIIGSAVKELGGKKALTGKQRVVLAVTFEALPVLFAGRSPQIQWRDDIDKTDAWVSARMFCDDLAAWCDTNALKMGEVSK